LRTQNVEALGGRGNAIRSVNQLTRCVRGEQETRSQPKLSQPARKDTGFINTLGLLSLSSNCW